jgi:hypothetical protein
MTRCQAQTLDAQAELPVCLTAELIATFVGAVTSIRTESTDSSESEYSDSSDSDKTESESGEVRIDIGESLDPTSTTRSVSWADMAEPPAPADGSATTQSKPSSASAVKALESKKNSLLTMVVGAHRCEPLVPDPCYADCVERTASAPEKVSCVKGLEGKKASYLSMLLSKAPGKKTCAKAYSTPTAAATESVVSEPAAPAKADAEQPAESAAPAGPSKKVHYRRGSFDNIARFWTKRIARPFSTLGGAVGNSPSAAESPRKISSTLPEAEIQALQDLFVGMNGQKWANASGWGQLESFPGKCFGWVSGPCSRSPHRDLPFVLR